jgi:hypothetical protein
METKITAMSSEVSFEDGSITNFIVLRVPSGHFVRAVVSEESAKLLADNFAAIHSGASFEESAPAPKPPPRKASAPKREMEDGAVVFGGDVAQEEEEESSVMWVPPPQEQPFSPPPAYANDPEAQAREYRRGKQKQAPNPMGVSNARTISKDEFGYPIPSPNGGVDPGELVGSVPGGEIDEDGIGSI